MSKAKSTNKELLEAGTTFTIKGYDSYEFKVKVEKDKTIFLQKYHSELSGLIATSALVRRLGENNLDYRDFDILGKRTRGRIQYADITFKVVADKPKKEKAKPKATKSAFQKKLGKLSDAKAKTDKFAKAKAKEDAKELVSSLTEKKEEPKVYGPQVEEALYEKTQENVKDV